jgi:hypothetical protein
MKEDERPRKREQFVIKSAAEIEKNQLGFPVLIWDKDTRLAMLSNFARHSAQDLGCSTVKQSQAAGIKPLMSPGEPIRGG